eukprot:TRINITY_DN519777_c0_g2_i1.p1 TRINITY_DN519777_c0_g2~~TRINITY_DN519777_c0_g2_i1.p1  ORF type:complete len:396 (-),score=113.08 TRINITY_DN519777_c0_g2_i1:6-1193(-)
MDKVNGDEDITSLSFLSKIRESVIPRSLVWLLAHNHNSVKKAAGAVLNVILNGDLDTLNAFIQLGCVPLLHRMFASSDEYASQTSTRIYSNLSDQIKAEKDSLLKTLCDVSDPERTSKLATAIVFLGFDSDELRQEFVEGGALVSLMSLLHDKSGRSEALDFLITMDELSRGSFDVNEAEELLKKTREDWKTFEGYFPDSQNEASNLKFFIGEKQKVFYAHQNVVMEAGGMFKVRLQQLKNPNALILPDEDYDSFVALMKWIYQGHKADFIKSEVMSSCDFVISLLGCTHRCEIPSLESECCLRLQELLSASTMIPILDAALKLEQTWLAIIAFSFCLDQIMPYLRESSPTNSKERLDKLVDVLHRFVVYLLHFPDESEGLANDDKIEKPSDDES